MCFLCAERQAPPGVVAIDDDCQSVTSREVADILFNAGPLAPPSDDDDDDDDDDYDVTTSDVTDEQRQRRLSSAVQLLRISSSDDDDDENNSLTTSPSNTSTGTASMGPATSIRPRNTHLTQFHTAAAPALGQLNNSRSGRRADEFWPQLNGGSDLGLVNGGHGPGLVSRGGQRLTLFDLLRTHHLVMASLQVRLKNGHHVSGPPFQVRSRWGFRLVGAWYLALSCTAIKSCIECNCWTKKLMLCLF